MDGIVGGNIELNVGQNKYIELNVNLVFWVPVL